MSAQCIGLWFLVCFHLASVRAAFSRRPVSFPLRHPRPRGAGRLWIPFPPGFRGSPGVPWASLGCSACSQGCECWLRPYWRARGITVHLCERVAWESHCTVTLGTLRRGGKCAICRLMAAAEVSSHKSRCRPGELGAEPRAGSWRGACLACESSALTLTRQRAKTRTQIRAHPQGGQQSALGLAGARLGTARVRCRGLCGEAEARSCPAPSCCSPSSASFTH